MNNKYDFHTIVIGGGSAGLVAASGLAGMGAKVALFEKEKMGGDCLNYGCVPSKAFLKSAHVANYIQKSSQFGIESHITGVDIKNVMKRVKSIISNIQPNDSKERYEKMGVSVFEKKAELIDKHTVYDGEKEYRAKYIVIATGSGPMVPPILGLNEVEYYTNKNIFDIDILPEHLIVLGAGPIGLELGQGFRLLSSKVTIVDMLPSLFTKDDPEVGPVMEQQLKDDGIELILGHKISSLKNSGNKIEVIAEKDGQEKNVSGTHILIALGRVPEKGDYGLKEVGIETDNRGYIVTDLTLKTSVPNIYACGDIVGPFQFTHMAGYQAGIVVKNIILPQKSKVDYSNVPWTTYTVPEVAHVGYTEPWAQKENIFKEKVLVKLPENDRAITEGEKRGFLKLILGKNDRLIGATMVGEKAGEIIPLASMAIKKKMSGSSFAGQIFSYPTESEIFKTASYSILKKKLKPWVKNIIKGLFLRY